MAAGSCLVLACLAAPAVGHLGGIFRYFQTGVTYVSTPFISVLLMGVISKRTNYAGAIFGLIGGLAIQVLLAIGLAAMGFRLHWLYVAFIAQILTMTGIAVVSLMSSPPPKSLWEPLEPVPAVALR